MAAKNIARVTLSLPRELAADLGYLSRRMGVSKSALVSELVQEASALAEILRELPEDGVTEEQLIRARGRSLQLVHDRVASARAAFGEDS